MKLLQSLRKQFRFIALFTLIFCIFSPSTFAQEGQAIGRVLSTTGSVTARDLGGALRELSRRSDIFVGDTVITGPNGFAQLRMVDSAQISFKEDTEFTFSSYSSDGPGGAADSALMEMVRGGFRTISGTIGDDGDDDYQVSTQFASIGIRGTTHEAVIDAGSLLTGVYDGGTTVANAQGSLDTGEGANFNYTQTFPGQAPQGLLQQPAQLGNINLDGAGGDNGDNDGDGDDGDGDDGDDGDGDDGNDGDDGDGGDGAGNDGNDGEGDDGSGNDGDDNTDDNNGANDDGGNNDGAGNDNANNDGDDNNGGIADANDDNAGARGLDNQPDNNPGAGIANQGSGNADVDPALDTTRTTETAINPVNDVREIEEFEETGTGTITRGPGNNNGNGNGNNSGGDDDNPITDPTPDPDPIPVVAELIQPDPDFITLVANSGFNSDFSLSELQGVTGRFSEVIAFDGIADVGGSIGAATVGDNGGITSITSLTMTFDLNFSANLAQVSNGFLGIKLDDAPQPIAFNIYFDGDIIDSQADFIISSISNRVQDNQATSINLETSFLDSILVDDGTEQALFSEFFFEDTQGLGVEGQALVGFATPVLSPADNVRISDRVGFILSRNAAPGSIFPGNVTELVPGQEVILAGNDLSSPFTLDAEPPYIFRGAGSFIDFTDGTITESGERPYDFEIGIWGSSSDPVALYTDFTDRSIFELIEDPLIVVSVDPAPISELSGNVIYMTNFDRILGGSSAGSISRFFTGFNVDFSASLITDGFMEFCLGGGASCSGENAQFWEFDFDGAVANGFVVASPVDNEGRINGQLASIFGFIEGVFTGANAEAFVGGFNLFYDDDLDIYRNELVDTAFNIPDTTVDGVFLIEREDRLSFSDVDQNLDDDAFLIQESYARNLLGWSRPTIDPILFVDRRSRPRLILTEGETPPVITQINQNLAPEISDAFQVNWERWEGPLLTFSNNLDDSVFDDGADDEISDIAFFSTFNRSEMTEITGHYENVLAFMGENNEETRISDITMSFDINFSASSAMNNIENGELLINIASLDADDESWLVFFEGGLERNMVDFNLLSANPANSSEQAGVYLTNLLTEVTTFENSLDIADSNMKGVIIDDSSVSSSPTPALLSSFYFRELLGSSPRRSVSGLALTGFGSAPVIPVETPEEDLPDLRFNNPDIDSGGILETDLVNIGVAVIGNPGSVSTNVGCSSSCMIYDYVYPVFGSNTTSKRDRPVLGQFTPTYSSSAPYTLSLERVLVNENNSTSSDTFFRNVGGYNVDWGIWDSPGTSNNGLFAYTDPLDLDVNENDFHEMPWLLVNDPQITSYNGSATYTHVLDFLGGNDSESIVDLFVAFDVDFSTALVSDGFMHVKTSGGNLWDANFSGAISGAFLNSTSLTGLFNNSYPISGEIAGAFTGLDNPSAPYNAFAGGFNFTKDGSESSYYLSGLFLAEREARLNAEEIRQSQHHLGILVDADSVSFGVASHPSSYAGGISPKVAINDRGNQSINAIDTTGPHDEVFSGTSTTTVQSTYLVTDMGYWESANMTIMHNQLNELLTTAISQDVFWANPVPADISDKTGTYFYNETGEFVGLSSLNGAIDEFSMAFSMDFTNGIVSNGTLHAGNDTANESWDATFTGGTVNGSFVEFTGIGGDFTDINNSSSCVSCVTGQISGVFTEDMYLNGQGFTTGFSLNNSAGGSGLTDSVFGIGALHNSE